MAEPSPGASLLVIHFENNVTRLKHFPGGNRADLLSGIREALGLSPDTPLRFLDEEGDVVVVSPSMPSGTILHASVAVGLHVSQMPSNNSILPTASQIPLSSSTQKFEFNVPGQWDFFADSSNAPPSAPTSLVSPNTPAIPPASASGFNFEPPTPFSFATSAPSTPGAFKFDLPSSTLPSSRLSQTTPFIFGSVEERRPTPAPTPTKWAFSQGGAIVDSQTTFKVTPRDGSEAWAVYSTPLPKTGPSYFVLKCAFRFCCTAIGVIPAVVSSVSKSQHLIGKDLSNRLPNCPKLVSLKGLLSSPSKAFDSFTGDKKEPVSIGILVDPENKIVLYLDDSDPKVSAKWLVVPVPAAAFPVKLVVQSPKHGTNLSLEDKPVPEFLTSSQRLTIKNEDKYRPKKEEDEDDSY